VKETKEQQLNAEQQRREEGGGNNGSPPDGRQQRHDGERVGAAEVNGAIRDGEAVEAELGSHQPPHVELSPRKVALLGLVLLIVFSIIFVLGFLPRLRDRRITQGLAEREETALPEVDVAAAQRATTQSDLELPGTTTGLVEAPIYARASGYISKRLVDIGDRVKAGQLMAVIDAPDLDQQVDQARSNLRQSESVVGQTQAQLNLARITWDRWNVLVQRGVLSKQEGDTQHANYLVAEANVKAAQSTVLANRAALDRLLHLQSYERVTAPFAGMVTARNIDVGSLISASGGGLGSGVSGAALPPTGNSQGGEMFRVAQIDRLRLFVTVPEVYAPYITVGEEVNCYFDAVRPTRFEGKVTRTANAVDPTTRTLLTEVQVPNPDGRLLPGMFTRAVFAHLRAEPPIIVPSDSIIARANGLSIAVVQDGVVHLRKVSIGRDYGAQTEVLSGINSGDMVIINPTDAAQEGAKVRPHYLKQSGPPAGSGTRRSSSQSVPPVNPEANVPLSSGPEPGAPGELQGPGPIDNPRPDYGAYDMPGKSQKSGAGQAIANPGNSAGGKAAAPGATGSNGTSSQPH
jgi:multidrug efflux pump subunit AcrA (membrane-fusion protein)